MKRLKVKLTLPILGCLLLVVTSCNQNKPEQNKEPLVAQTMPAPVVLTPGTDTLKTPEVFELSNMPAPKVIAVPTKNGGFYTSAYDSLAPQGKPYFTNYTTDDGLALDAISCSMMDKTGNLWFGTVGGGVSRYDGKSFTNFTTAQGLANNTVISITADKTGNLWFGTDGGGVSRYDGKSFTNYTTAQGLANNFIISITADKTGNLWFGTIGGGVILYDGKSFTNYTTAQGLANNFIDLGI